jgi:hypothetical protein
VAGRSGGAGSPGAGNQPPVPLQQRLGLDEEARPAGAGQHPADRGQPGPVSGLQPGTWGLPPEDSQLMAKDEELQVLGGVAAGEQHEQLDGATQRNVGGFRQHQGDLRVGGRTATLPSHDRRKWAAHRPTSAFAYPTGSLLTF